MSISWMATAAGPGWYDNLDQALQVARQEGKPVFVDFSTSWCGVCKQMDRTTLADPAVLSRLENFVKVKVDGDAFPQVCQAFGVEAYPTFVHLDSQGRVLAKREGGMRVQEMAVALDRTLRIAPPNTAIAQAAPRQPRAPQQQPQQAAQGQPQIASTNLLMAPGTAPQAETRTVSREAAANMSAQVGNGAGGSLYNMTNDPFQGNSVYDTESASSGRRSRFGGGNGGLKELAEATAQPQTAQQLPPMEAPAAVAEEAKPQAEEKAAEDKTIARAADAESESSRNEAEQKSSEEKKPEAARAEVASAPNRAASPAAAVSSPVIESRLAGLSTEALPQPLLSRSASGATQKMEPREVASVAEVRRIPAAVKSSEASDESKSVADVPAPAESSKKEVASAAPKKVVTSAVKTAEGSKAREKEEEKSSGGATSSDIDRWMKDADSKLVEAHKTDNVQKKREARAMYNKVVEKDPENKFGKSDMAYIKMVSLIVDRDSDLLRRQAYTRIKEFEERFPSSSHKDYYTLIRAMLATDLDEITEARDLLGNYAEQYPDSKYLKVAEETYKSLPSSKKVASKKK